MTRRTPLFVIFLTLLGALNTPLAAQRRVDDRNFGERIFIIAPMIGDGSVQNPFRPLFAPSPDEIKPGGFIGYTSVLSDDKKYALIELVAHDRKAFDAILKDARTDVKKFDHIKGAKKEDIELEFRKYKKGFDFVKFKEGK